MRYAAGGGISQQLTNARADLSNKDANLASLRVLVYMRCMSSSERPNFWAISALGTPNCSSRRMASSFCRQFVPFRSTSRMGTSPKPSGRSPNK